MLMRFAIIVTALVVMVGCADVPVVGRRQQSDQSWVFASTLMGSSGPLLVQIEGRPYVMDEAQLNDIVVNEMARAITWSSDARFTTDPEEAGSQTMRVVWRFNAGSGGRPQCRGEGQGEGPAAGGAVLINAVFCDDDYVISDVTGSIQSTRGPDDPVFSNLIQQVALELFPRGIERNRNPLFVN